jgi:signal transduction histidine kinase
MRPRVEPKPSMRQRVEAVGGSLTITSAPGDGIPINATVPID